MEQHNLTQDMVAQKVGKSRPAVANALRLLNLPDSVIQLVRNGELSSGHARALLALDDEAEMQDLAQKAAKGLVTVRDIEKYSKKDMAQTEKKGRTTPASSRDSFYDEMEIALRQELGRKIKITMNGTKGTLEIEFYNKEELSDLAERLARE